MKVLTVRRRSKIIPAIVETIAVAVIYEFSWVFACHQLPDDPLRQVVIKLSVGSDSNREIAARRDGSRRLSGALVIEPDRCSVGAAFPTPAK
jgi:hypothetical protein